MISRLYSRTARWLLWGVALFVALPASARADVFAWYELVDSIGPGAGVVAVQQGESGQPLIVSTDSTLGAYTLTIRFVAQVESPEAIIAYAVDLFSPTAGNVVVTDFTYLGQFDADGIFTLGNGPGRIIEGAGQFSFFGSQQGLLDLFEFVMVVTGPPAQDLELFSGIGSLAWASESGQPIDIVYADSDPLGGDEVFAQSSTPSIIVRQGQPEDCNENGIPDAEEIAADPSLDCNLNEVLDECDIADGTSPDCQPDGIPDECQLGEAEPVTVLAEGFDDISLLPDADWAMINNSDPIGDLGWFQGDVATFIAHTGNSDAYIGANWQSVDDGTISNWLLTPEIDLIDGMELSFYTRTTASSGWPDRLEVRMSLAGASLDVGTAAEDVGDFTELLLEINPDLTVGGYPETWEQFTVVLSGIGATTKGRLALRYFVTDGGSNGTNSNYIGIDTATLTSPATANSNDCNDNGVPDECDLADGDCNENGVPDACDIADGTLVDVDGNGIPDSCESDCNGNGVADGQDIAQGTSLDCNENGVPDECDVADATSPDCNNNGIPDPCDISSGQGSLDCNGNGVPDECDLADATSADCNANGVPDPCDLSEGGASQDCNDNDVPDECDLAAGTNGDCNGNQVPDTCDIATDTSRDCNNNDVPDGCELAAGAAGDCNGNGVPDGCDLTDGTSGDCNLNGIPDACDIAGGGSLDAGDNGIPDECEAPPGGSPGGGTGGNPFFDRRVLRDTLAFLFDYPAEGRETLGSMPMRLFGIFGAPMSAALTFLEWLNLPVRAILFEFFYAVLDAILP